MKHRHSTILATLALAAVSPCQAPLTQYSGSLYYDLKDRYTAAVVLTNVGSLTLKGKKLLDVSALAGIRNGDSRAIVGIEIGKSWQLFDQVSVHAGIAAVQAQGSKPSAGIVLGLSYRF